MSREMHNDQCKMHRPDASHVVPVAFLIVHCAWLVAAAACEHAPQSTARATLRPVPLPDLSRAAKPVQDQLRERYASLILKIESRATPAVDLANEYGETGKLLMAAEYRDAAEPCFLNAQALVPGDARWPYYLAHLYRLRNEPEKSAMFFDKALQLRPDDVAALVWLGGLYLLQGRPEAAEPLFIKALTRQPRLAAALSGLGRAAVARRDYAGAVKYLEEALAQDPSASIVHYPLAIAYRAIGEVEKADAHLRQRGHVDPTLPDPMMSGERIAAQRREYRAARGQRARQRRVVGGGGYFRKGVELAPDNPSVRHGWHRVVPERRARAAWNNSKKWCDDRPILPRRATASACS